MQAYNLFWPRYKYFRYSAVLLRRGFFFGVGDSVRGTLCDAVFVFPILTASNFCTCPLIIVCFIPAVQKPLI